jgi:hypothetical protein
VIELEQVELEFDAATRKDARSLSGVAADGDYLFVAPDEGTSIVRLRRDEKHSRKYRQTDAYPVGGLVPVPGDKKDEIDLEGMDIADGFLWLAGSHSAVRKRVKDDTTPEQIPGRLAKVDHPKARRLLACIPLDDGDDQDGPQPVRTAERSGETVHAASLPGDDGGLHALLEQDVHLGPFLDLPGKDNGLDLEGLAVVGSRVLLGLRGPVLRGWAVILEIEPRPSKTDPETLELAPIGRHDPPVRFVKHFLNLGGLGIRDLARHNGDLLILAGPTMVLDGPSRVLRFRGGARNPLPEAVTALDLEQIGDDLPVGSGKDGSGKDHPEAITVVTDPAGPRLLVLYDNPSEDRVKPEGVRGDLLPLN